MSDYMEGYNEGYDAAADRYADRIAEIEAELAAERENREQLGLFCVKIGGRGYFVCESVAQEIERLRAELAAERELSQSHYDTWAAEVDARGKVEATIAKLREALEPFCHDDYSDDWDDVSVIEVSVQLGDLRRARAVLAQIEKQEEDDDGQPDEMTEWHDYDPDC